MKGKIFKIKNAEDELVLPITTTEAIYMEDGKTLNDEINDINSSLDNKANKNEVFSMANMGQDIKEAMTGGSVAVVGTYSVDSVNLIKNSVTKNKTDFLTTNVVNLLNLANSEITNVNYSTGVKPNYICDDNSLVCNTNDEDWLFFFIKLNLEVGKTYSCTLKNTNLNKDIDVGISYVNEPTEPKKFTFNKNNGEYKLTFECVSEINYIRIHGINGGINIKDIIFYEGSEEEVVWSLDKDVHVTNIGDGTIEYKKLADDIKQLFIKIEDLFNINGFEFLAGNNVKTFKNNNDDTFYVEFNEGASYLIFKGQQFKKGHKYVVAYDVTGDVDFRIGLRNSRIGYASWQENIIETTNQTGGATSLGYKIYNCEYDGCLAFNNSCSKAVKYTAKIKIFDVTEYSNEEIKKIDFLAVGHSAIFLKNVGSSENSASSSSLANKKIVFYGDSICQNGYFQNMIKNYYNCNVVTNAIGGTTVGYTGENSFSSDTRINNLPNDADFVLIMGGTNDWNRVNIGSIDFSSSSIDRTTLKGGFLYTIKGIQEQCPKATIIVCTAIGGRGTSATSTHLYPLVDQYGQSTLDIRNATVEVANIANVECCDTWSCGINGFNRTKYIADAVHPNTEGNTLLGNYIINFLKKYN